MIEMVVGFLFDGSSENVLLIQKNRPVWQVGLLNGPGGKFEEEDEGSPVKAMLREFYQETGQRLDNGRKIHFFRHFATLNGSGWRVYYFAAHSNLSIEMKEDPTDEKQIIVRIDELPSNVVPNLRWLIPMALDYDLLQPVIIYNKRSNDRLVWDDS